MFVYGGVVVYGAFSRFFSSSFSLCVYFLRFSRRFSDSAAARESFVPEPTAERAKIKENVPNEKKRLGDNIFTQHPQLPVCRGKQGEVNEKSVANFGM